MLLASGRRLVCSFAGVHSLCEKYTQHTVIHTQ
eukprot:COSAG01_NODE_33569_length_562_cov_0.762419_2_plen_32_part_01